MEINKYIIRTILRVFRLSIGAEVTVPKYSTSTATNTPSTGNVFYCIKPLGANVTISSAKDINGNAISALANVEIQRGDEFKEILSEITFTSGTVVRLYEKVKQDEF